MTRARAGVRHARSARLLAGLSLAVAGAFAAGGCEDTTEPQDDRTVVNGEVADSQLDTRLFFYDDELVQLGPLSIRVRSDGTFGPLSFEPGAYFGAATAAGFTSGEFLRFEITASQDTAPPLLFDLDPITVPRAVGNRWTYDEVLFRPAPDTLTRVVEITAQQAGPGDGVFTVEERLVDPGTGSGETVTYFLAQDQTGIRKSLDAVIDETDELLLRLPATLATSWTTVDAVTGQQVQKRITGFACDEDGCFERNDFTVAEEPAGVFMSVSEIHSVGSRLLVTTFSDVGIVDQFEQENGQLTVQRRLRAVQLSGGG